MITICSISARVKEVVILVVFDDEVTLDGDDGVAVPARDGFLRVIHCVSPVGSFCDGFCQYFSSSNFRYCSINSFSY